LNTDGFSVDVLVGAKVIIHLFYPFEVFNHTHMLYLRLTSTKMYIW